MDIVGSRTLATALEDKVRRCLHLTHVLESRPFVALVRAMPDTAPAINVASRDEISLQYTSGTTAKPKGVLLTHANYIYGGEAMVKAMRVAPVDRHLIVLPLFHAGAQLHAFIPMLLVGGS